jgi:hypothetical protein
MLTLEELEAREYPKGPEAPASAPPPINVGVLDEITLTLVGMRKCPEVIRRWMRGD